MPFIQEVFPETKPVIEKLKIPSTAASVHRILR